MASVSENKRIIIKGGGNWLPVLLNIMSKAGIKADILTAFKRRGQSALWLFSRKSRPYGIIYHVRGCTAIFCVLARLRGKRMVSHWIGTDAMCYQGKLNLRKRLSIWVHQHLVDLELADSEIIQEELRAIGIETKLLRLLPQAIVSEVTALPEESRVLSYWFDDRFDFYGGPIIFALARAFSETEFLIAQASGKGLTDIPANVRFLGLVDNMPEIYRKCTCLIRLPRHDGLSAMVLEALARGRYVIYNRKFPFTSFAKDFDSACKALEEILKKEEPNSEGADYVKKNFSVDEQADRLRELMENSFGI
jgi:glycosyltransferase involved in cell wall biosynthesis